MQLKAIVKLAALLLPVLILSVSASAQGKQGSKPPQREFTDAELLEMSMKAKLAPPPALTFKIGLADNQPDLFTLTLSDSAGKVVYESFNLSKLPILSAIVNEALNFSRTPEAVGTNKAVVTRFYDKQLPNLLVDVAKIGDRSQFYVTLKSVTGFVTIEAGTLRRSEKNPNPFFFDIVKKVEAAKEGKWGQM